MESNVGTLYGIVCLDLAREHALFSSASARPDCGWMDGWTGGWSMGHSAGGTTVASAGYNDIM